MEQAKILCQENWPVTIDLSREGLYEGLILQVNARKVPWQARVIIKRIVRIADDPQIGYRPGEVVSAPNIRVRAVEQMSGAETYLEALEKKITELQEKLKLNKGRSDLDKLLKIYQRTAEFEQLDPPPSSSADAADFKQWRENPKPIYTLGDEITVRFGRTPPEKTLKLLKQFGFMYQSGDKSWHAPHTPEREALVLFLAGDQTDLPTAPVMVRHRSNGYRLEMISGKKTILLYTPNRLTDTVIHEIWKAGFRWAATAWMATYTQEREALAQKVANGYGLLEEKSQVCFEMEESIPASLCY